MVEMERGQHTVCRKYTQAKCAPASLVFFMTNAIWPATRSDARVHRTQRPIPLEELTG